jgi:hypothetical protein
MVMKPSVLTSAIAVFCLLINCFTAHAQDLTGIWRGYFITEGGDQYKYELQLDQTNKNGINGVSYSYLDTRFYGKATLTGNYAKPINTALVQEIKTVELRMAGSSVACIMKCQVSYIKSGKEEFLEGTYTSIYEKNNAAFGIKRGGDCGSGKVFLRKVPTSDFYTEPFLQKKLKKTPETKIETPKPNTSIASTSKPSTKSPLPNKRKPATPPKNDEVIIKRPKLDSIKTPRNEPIVPQNSQIGQKITTTPIQTRERKNELTKTLIVNNQDIEIRLYDNGEVDGDTVSIYLDGKLVLANQGLSEKAITYKLHIDASQPEHTLIMVAENMGRIPPNTSLMIVQDGDKRYFVGITSTEQKNAMVRFRYEKPD